MMAILVSVACILAAVAICFAFSISIKKNYYRFRNILFVALFVSAIMMAIGFAIYGFGGLAFEQTDSIIPQMVFGKGGSGADVFAPKLPEAVLAFVKADTKIMVVLLAILCVVMSASNLSLIKHEGLKPKNVVGAGLEVVFIVFSIMIYVLDEAVLEPLAILSNNDYLVDRCFRLLFFLYSFAFYLDMILVGIFVMGWLAARQHPKYDKDFIIIPGCSIRKDGGLLPLLKGRTNRAIKYAWEQEIACGKNVLFVPSGGQGPGEIISEGSAMEMYLISHSAEQDEVYAEKQSRNTYENFYFSKKIIEQINPDAKVAFATTNYHVLRCGMLAHKVGMEAEGIASDTKWYFWPNGFAREVIAIFALTGRKHLIAVLALLFIGLLI